MFEVFSFLNEKKNKPIPLQVKLLYKSPLGVSDLMVNGDFYLYNSKIESLPDDLIINGSLYICNTEIKQLPNNLTVNGDLELLNTKIYSLPKNLKVKGYFYCVDSPLTNKLRNNKTIYAQCKKMILGRIFF